MGMKPPIITDITTRFSFIFDNLDFLYIGVWVTVYFGFLPTNYMLMLVAFSFTLWLFAWFAGVVELKGRTGARLLVISLLILVAELILSALRQEQLSLNIFENSYLLTGLLLLFILTTAYVKRFEIYMWALSFVLLIDVSLKLFTTTKLTLPISFLALVTIIALWIWFAYEQILMRVLFAILFLTIIYMWYLLGISNVPLELWLGLFAIFVVDTSGVTLIPLIGMGYWFWQNYSIFNTVLDWAKALIENLKTFDIKTLNYKTLPLSSSVELVLVTVIYFKMMYFALKRFYLTVNRFKRAIYLTSIGLGTYLLASLLFNNMSFVTYPSVLVLIYLFGLTGASNETTKA